MLVHGTPSGEVILRVPREGTDQRGEPRVGFGRGYGGGAPGAQRTLHGRDPGYRVDHRGGSPGEGDQRELVQGVLVAIQERIDGLMGEYTLPLGGGLTLNEEREDRGACGGRAPSPQWEGQGHHWGDHPPGGGDGERTYRKAAAAVEGRGDCGRRELGYDTTRGGASRDLDLEGREWGEQGDRDRGPPWSPEAS